jgi:iron complex outermembrane recepter protein
MNLQFSFESKFTPSFFVVVSLLFASLFPVVSSAQTSVSGHIFSSTGSPVFGANIYSHAYELGATTDSLGYFVIDGFPKHLNSSSSKIILHISIIGFKTQMVNTSTGNKSLVVTLENDLMDLDEVLIEADRSHSQNTCLVKIATMTVEQLDRSSSPSRIQALSSEPGVDMISMGGGVLKPVIRGLSGLRVITLLRGTRIESQAWGAEHGIYMPEQGVDRVEIIRGPSALAFGADAIGGVLNFIPENPLTEIGRKSTISLRGFSASSGLQTSLATKKRSRHSHHAFSGGYNSHGDYSLPDGALVSNSFYRQFFGQGFWGYIRDWGKIDGAYSSSYNTAGLLGSEGYQQSGDHIITSSATFYSDSWIVKPSISYQLNHRKEFDSPRQSNVPPDSLSLPPSLIEPELDLALRSYKYGATAVNDDDLLDVTIGVSRVSTSNDNELTDAPFIPDASINESGAFAFSSYHIGDLLLQAGSRLDYVSIVVPGQFERTFSNPSYSLGAVYTINPQSDLRLSYSRGNRVPGLSELAADGIHHGAYRYEIGDSNLDSEASRNFDFAYSLNSTSISLEASIFRNTINNFIHLSSTEVEIEGFSVYQFAASTAVLSGAEMSLSVSPKLIPGLSFNSALSYIVGNIEDDAIPFIPPTNLRTTISWKSESGLHASVSSLLVDRASSIEFSSPGYSVLDFTAGSVISERLTWGVACSNILNTSYIPHLSLTRELGIAMPGRNISFRLSFVL